MHISRIEMHNYRALQPLNVDVRKHAVFIGPNESGKSSLLRAVGLLLGATGAQLAGSFSASDFSDPEKAVVIEVDLADLSEVEEGAFADEIDTSTGIVTLRLEATTDTSTSEIIVDRFFPAKGRSYRFSIEQRNQVGWVLVRASRSAARDLSMQGSGMLRSVLAGLELGEDSEAWQTAMTSLRDGLDSWTAVLGFREEFAAALSLALPRQIEAASVRLVPVADVGDSPLDGVALVVEDNEGRQVPISQQSDGIQALSLIAVHGMALGAGHILAIDEPETHLHPTAQSALGFQLASGTQQRMVATHSSLVASAFDPADLIVLLPGSEPRTLSTASPALEKKFVARWWRHGAIEPLTARAAILVEGPADWLVVRAAARLIDMDLDRLGISLVDLGGKSGFRHTRRLLGDHGFNVPLFGLVDEDGEQEWASELGIPAGDLANKGIHVARPDLEGMYAEALGGPSLATLLMDSGSYEEQHLLHACSAASLSEITTVGVAAFCRADSRKVEAARIVGEGLTKDSVLLMDALVGVLKAAAGV